MQSMCHVAWWQINPCPDAALTLQHTRLLLLPPLPLLPPLLLLLLLKHVALHPTLLLQLPALSFTILLPRQKQSTDT